MSQNWGLGGNFVFQTRYQKSQNKARKGVSSKKKRHWGQIQITTGSTHVLTQKWSKNTTVEPKSKNVGLRGLLLKEITAKLANWAVTTNWGGVYTWPTIFTSPYPWKTCNARWTNAGAHRRCGRGPWKYSSKNNPKLTNLATNWAIEN